MAEVTVVVYKQYQKVNTKRPTPLGLSYWKKRGYYSASSSKNHNPFNFRNTFIGLFKDTSLVLIIGKFMYRFRIGQAANTDPEWLGFSTEVMYLSR